MPKGGCYNLSYVSKPRSANEFDFSLDAISKVPGVSRFTLRAVCKVDCPLAERCLLATSSNVIGSWPNENNRDTDRANRQNRYSVATFICFVQFKIRNCSLA